MGSLVVESEHGRRLWCVVHYSSGLCVQKEALPSPNTCFLGKVYCDIANDLGLGGGALNVRVSAALNAS